MRFRRFATAVAVTAVMAFAPGLASAGYTIEDIGHLGGRGSNALHINASGQVAGASTLPSDGGVRAITWSAGTMTNLGPPGLNQNSGSIAHSVNDSGVAVGFVSRVESGLNTASALVWTGADIIYLPIPAGGNFNYATDINNAGVVTGYSQVAVNPTSRFEAWIFDGDYRTGSPTFLGTLGGASSQATAINAAGQVVGYSETASGATRGFVWSGGVMTPIGTLGGSYSVATDINDAGTVVGSGDTASGVVHSFIWKGSSLIDIGSFGADTRASAINRHDDVVGTVDFPSGQRAFLWRGGRFIDLTAALDPADGWVLNTAADINDRGQIVGIGIHNGFQRGYVLDFGSPAAVPEPASVGLAAVGLAAVGLAVGLLRARRQRGR